MKKMESRRIFVTLLTVGSLGGLGLESTLAGHHGCHVSFGGGHHHHHAVGVSPVLLYSSLYRPSHPSYHSYGTSSSSSLGYTVPAVNPPVLREIPPLLPGDAWPVQNNNCSAMEATLFPGQLPSPQLPFAGAVENKQLLPMENTATFMPTIVEESEENLQEDSSGQQELISQQKQIIICEQGKMAQHQGEIAGLYNEMGEIEQQIRNLKGKMFDFHRKSKIKELEERHERSQATIHLKQSQISICQANISSCQNRLSTLLP